MAILNPDHLLDQANRLILPPPKGPPRQVDLRRAISSAYYAVFHKVLIATANEFVGGVHQGSRDYALVFRSVDHGRIKSVCRDIVAAQPSPQIRAYVPDGGFDAGIRSFADAFPGLQEQRHAADYDPLARYRTSDAKAAIATARTAMDRFADAPPEDRKTFLYLLLFTPKR